MKVGLNTQLRLIVQVNFCCNVRIEKIVLHIQAKIEIFMYATASRYELGLINVS